MNSRPKTIFCDIDGTLVEHPVSESGRNDDLEYNMKTLPGTIQKLWEWDKLGYNIILTTGRKESLRKATEEQLLKVGIIYDQLIMGIGGGVRVLINDKKAGDENETALAISLKRNEGIKDIDV
jgi:hypothetical protein